MSNWKSTKCCGTCALWSIESAKTKSGSVRSNRSARCGWRSIEATPTALRDHMKSSRIPGYITRDDGDGCPCYIKREEKQK